MARTKSLVRPHLENWARFKDHISGKTVNNKERSRRESIVEGTRALAGAGSCCSRTGYSKWGFTVKAPKLETSKEFQGNGESDIDLSSLSFPVSTAMLLKGLMIL